MLCKLTLNYPLGIIQKNNIHLALKDIVINEAIEWLTVGVRYTP